MARMSIDDMVARDPRITLLAQELGWSRRETIGCLVSDIWPICYDQEHWLISPRIINAAAGNADFADALVNCELATRDRSGKLQIKGAKDRIKYLEKKGEAGRLGGLKSAEARRKKSSKSQASGEAHLKQARSTPQARRNPSAPDSALVPDPVPDPVPDTHYVVPDSPGLNIRPASSEQDEPVSAAAAAPEEQDIAKTGSGVPVVKRKAKSAAPVPAEVQNAARALLDAILRILPKGVLANGGQTKQAAALASWSDQFRLMHDRDGRTYPEILDMIAWVEIDPFWRTNILSADAIRRQWDKLVLARERAPRRGPASTNDPRFGRIDPDRYNPGDYAEDFEK